MMWNPEDYAKNSDAQLKWARELRAKLDLQGNDSVLDVGCGDGKITADFVVALPRGKVIGVDSSAQMIDYATRTYAIAQYPNLSFACIDARSLDFENEFDLIFSNATLHWVDNHQAFLQGASRALRSGGRLIVGCGGKGCATDVLQVFSELLNSKPWSEYFGDFHNPYFFYSDREYKLWLEEAGIVLNK